MTAIRFDKVTKSYPRYAEMLRGFKSSILALPTTVKALFGGDFEALKDVSFSIEQGETVGFVGCNGAGKSTILGLVAGVLWPQKGTVAVRGRVAPLLELGAGFHQELTGLENIYLNGILLGLTKRAVRQKVDSIVEFSELGSFLDQPIRTYSTGMLARLGFSVACHLEPDILLIDEVLAVGDISFQAKCRDKVREFQGQGITIVLVSHSGANIRELCSRAIWMEGGCVRAEGPAGAILDSYETAALRGDAPIRP